jgi:anti-anti-sigma factor
MSQHALLQLRPDLVEGVAILDLLPREITEPDQAALLGEALRSVYAAIGSKRLLLDMAATKYLSSTAFAVLFSFGLDVTDDGGRLAISSMDEFVRVGADIVKLGRVVPIYDDEKTALASLIL